MKVVVLTSGVKGKRIWEGTLSQVPHVGEGVFVPTKTDPEGPLADEIVQSVDYDLDEKVAYITLCTHDEDNIYPNLSPKQ